MSGLLARARRLVDENPAATALFAAALGLRVFLLGAKSLWLDESMTLALSTQPLARLAGLVRTNELLPPLHYLLMHVWLELFADPLIGARAFSVLCGLATLAVLRRTARRLLPEHALLALALGAFSSFWIDVAQSGRPYALYLFLAALSFDLFAGLADGWRTRDGVLYALVGALGLYTHYYFAFVLLGQLAYVGFRRRREPAALRPWLLTAAFWVLAFAPWVPSLRAQLSIYAGKPTLADPFGWRQACDLVGTMFCDVSLLALLFGGWVRLVGAALIVALAAGVRLGPPLEPSERPRLALLWSQLLVPPLAAKLAELALGRPMTQARYFVFLSVPAYLLAAFLVGRLAWRRRRLALAGLALVLGAGVVGYDVAALDVDSRLGDLAAVVRKAARPGDVVVHLNPYFYTSLRYYYLPELPHFLLDASSPMLNWSALPGYPAPLPEKLLPRLKRVFVIDPERRLSPNRLAAGTGATLARLRQNGAAKASVTPTVTDQSGDAALKPRR